MGIESGFALEGAEVETVAGAGIENHVVGSRGDGLRDGQTQTFGHPQVMQTPPRGNGFWCIAWTLGSPFLRLKQVDISAPSDVEGMSARTEHPPFLAYKPQMAVAYGAK